MIPYMVGKLTPNSTHSTRGLVKNVPSRGYFRAIPSQNGGQNCSSPPPSIIEQVSPRSLHATMIVIACGSTSQERLQYSGRPYPACLPENETAVIAHATTVQFNNYTHTNTHTHIHTHTHTPWEDQCEWHRMTTMTGPDCAVMCNLINTHTHTHTPFRNEYH